MHLDIKGVADYLESVTHQKNRNYSRRRRSVEMRDIRECAHIAARMFDHIIIRQEKSF
jgi:cyanophycin synthetase